MTSLIEAFQRPEEDDRIDALEALVRSLGLSDVRRLRALTAARLDFVAKLPAEILTLIFQQLPLEAAWTSQLVCSRWRAVLSESGFLMARLNQDGWRDSRQSSKPTADAVREVCRHRQAFRNGRPFTHWSVAYASDETRSAPIQRQAMRLALHERQLAWIAKDDGRSRVVLRDLSTGVVDQFFGEAREDIMCLALTSCLLAYVSFDGILYIVDLTTAERKPQTFRLPSTNIVTVAGDGKVVGLLLPGGKTHTIVHIDFSEHIKTLRSVILDTIEASRDSRGPSLQPHAMIVDGAHLIFDIFTMAPTHATEAANKTSPRLGHMRFSLRESREQATALSSAVSTVLELPLKTGAPGGITLKVAHCSEPDLVELEVQTNGHQCAYVTFSRQSASLTVPNPDDRSTPEPRGHSIMRWHDAFIHVTEREEEGCISSLRLKFCPEDDKWRYEDHGLTTWKAEYADPDWTILTTELVLRNEHYIVVCSSQRRIRPSASTRTIVRVLGMDEQLPLADGQSTGLWRSAIESAKTPPSMHAFRYRSINFYSAR